MKAPVNGLMKPQNERRYKAYIKRTIKCPSITKFPWRRKEYKKKRRNTDKKRRGTRDPARTKATRTSTLIIRPDVVERRKLKKRIPITATPPTSPNTSLVATGRRNQKTKKKKRRRITRKEYAVRRTKTSVYRDDD